MTLENIYDIGQTIAVIMSLGFVGYQIRQNTRALKANSHHAVTDSFNALNALVIADPRVARLFREGMADWASLDADDQISASYIFLAYQRIFETLHYQHGAGALEGALFAAELNTLKWGVAHRGFQQWWAANPISLSAEYRAFIDGLIRDAKASSEASS